MTLVPIIKFELVPNRLLYMLNYTNVFNFAALDSTFIIFDSVEPIDDYFFLEYLFVLIHPIGRAGCIHFIRIFHGNPFYITRYNHNLIFILISFRILSK